MDTFKSGFVCIMGKPNVGKSTLLNQIVGEKIAITTNKPQTTRNTIKGIITDDEAQIVFVDTPGIHRPKHKLGKIMNKNVDNTISDTDVVIMLIDASRKKSDQELVIEKLRRIRVPIILAINKVDMIKDKLELLNIIEEYKNIFDFQAIIPISAKTGDGVDSIIAEVKKYLPYGPKYFPDDSLSDTPRRVIAAEIIREKALILLAEEIPHGIAVEIEKMKQREDKNIIDISAIIYCERDSHKGIIIGKGGAMLKDIGRLARSELEKSLESKVFLELWVKVKKNWRDSEKELRRLDFNEEI